MKRLVLVLAIGACADEPLTVDTYPVIWRDAGCDLLFRCGVTPTLQQCLETRSAFPYSANLVAAVEAGTVRWHADAAEDCVERLGQLTCDRTSESFRYLGCDRVFTGALEADESCVLDVECIGGECWTGSCTDACCIGYCVGDTPPTPAELGEVCGIASCVAGAYCKDRECVSLLGAGETCDGRDGETCGYGLVCIDTVCQASADTGAPCTKNEQCFVLGDMCDQRGVCAPAGQVGAPCASTENCALHLVCDVYQRCARGPRVGERCDSLWGSDECYDANAYCSSSTDTCTVYTPGDPTCVSQPD